MLAFIFKFLRPKSKLGVSISRDGLTSGGFTLIEMMVATALFSVVMVVSVTALLAVVSASRRAQAVQTIIDSLDFALDDMSRTIRTGTSFHCATEVVVTKPEDGIPDGDRSKPSNCPSGNTYISLEGSHGDSSNFGDQIIYWFAPATTCGPEYTGYCVMKSTDGGQNYLPITSPEITIDKASFSVVGACPRTGTGCSGAPENDKLQPRALLILRGHIDYQGKVIANIDLESTMTQRVYDI